MKTLLRILKWIVIVIAFLAIVSGLLAFYLHTDISEERESRMRDSEHYVDGAFVNEERQAESDIDMAFLQEQFFGDQQREPEGAVPVIAIDAADLQSKAEPGLRAAWLGHATVLVEIDGYRVLTDPVLSQRVSPFQFVGPKRTHETPIALEELTGIDAVVISHNHYDHLDEATVRHLAADGTKFFVPLGVGQYLEDWNIPADQVVEMDWWQSSQLGGLTITATPNRHYSNRGLLDNKSTHWSSWSISGETHKIFYSGDSGYSRFFAEIGERIGPFDLNIIKIGSYGPGQAWRDIHMTPEEAIQVHVDVGGKRLLPVHWMTFNLGMHDWDEPIKRAMTAATARNVEMVAPKIGEIVAADQPFTSEAWWDDVK